MNAMRISREPTQAFVQCRAWAGDGYISLINTPPCPTQVPRPSTLVLRVRSKKKRKAYIVITKSISKLSRNTEALKSWLPQLCTWGPGWYLLICHSHSGAGSPALTKTILWEEKSQ